MTSRRTFLKIASLGGTALALPAVSAAASATALPSGKLCVLVYGRPRERLPDDCFSQVVVIDLPSGAVQRIPSPVPNLHGLLEAGPSYSQLWGVGHESPEVLDVFDAQMNRLETRNYPGFTFRGHGIRCPGGVLVAAERTDDPMTGGLLLQFDAAGKCVAQHPTGGLRPHEIVACGEFLAVAHYGNRGRPRRPAPGANAGYAGVPGSTLLLDTLSPGVSFLRRDTLEVVAFHQLPGAGATSHLGVQGEQVLAMGLNVALVPTVVDLYRLAEREHAMLLPSEVSAKAYEIYVPMARVDPVKGVISNIDEGPAKMRRGQSFASSTKAGVVAATYAASQTLFLQSPGQPARWMNTLELGVPNPRGCALLGDGQFVAVSGHDDNIAIVDVQSGQLVRLLGVPLGGHSHLFWVAAG